MAVPAMRAGDVVVPLQRFAHADRDGFFADIEVREPGHERPRVEVVDALLEEPDGDHLSIEPEQHVLADFEARQGRVERIGCRHTGTPDILAST